MRLQVLIATQGQSGHRLLDQMQISSDAIIGNQCGRYEVETFSFHGYDVRFIPTGNEGGLKPGPHLDARADADICLFADDDVRYDDHYAEKFSRFSKLPERTSSFLIFTAKTRRARVYHPEMKRVRCFNSLHMGPIGSRSVPSVSAAPTSLSLFCLAVAPVMAPGRTASFCTTVSGMASKFMHAPSF